MKKSVLLQIITEEISKMMKEDTNYSVKAGVDVYRDPPRVYLDVEGVVDNLLKLPKVTEDNVDKLAAKLFGVNPQDTPDAYKIEFNYEDGRVIYHGKLKPTPQGEAFIEKLYDLYEKKYKFDLFGGYQAPY
jgi:hypothetical protein